MNQFLNELNRFEKRVLSKRIVKRSEAHSKLFILKKFEVEFGYFYNELNASFVLPIKMVHT
jgi:hypothetical protein